MKTDLTKAGSFLKVDLCRDVSPRPPVVEDSMLVLGNEALVLGNSALVI